MKTKLTLIAGIMLISMAAMAQAQSCSGGPDKVICLGESVTLNEGGDASYNYIWDGVPLIYINSASPVVSPSSDQVYTVSIYSNGSVCTAKDEVFVTVKNPLGPISFTSN